MLTFFLVHADKSFAAIIEPATKGSLSSDACYFVDVYEATHKVEAEWKNKESICFIAPFYFRVPVQEWSFLAGMEYLPIRVNFVFVLRYWCEKQSFWIPPNEFDVRNAFDDFCVRLSYVGNYQIDMNEFTIWPTRYVSLSEDQFWPMSRCKFLPSEFKLTLASAPQFVGGSFECESKITDSNSSKSRDDGRNSVKMFSDLSQRDQDYVVKGAIFIGGIFSGFFCILAYLYIRR